MRLAIEARFHESALQMQAIREGLHSIVPAHALALLTWEELELRVCGRPTVDIASLQRSTHYSPSHYNLQSPAIRNFWKARVARPLVLFTVCCLYANRCTVRAQQVLTSFSDEERRNFLQFAWARSRLPSESGTYRMQLNILEYREAVVPNHKMLLPTSETVSSELFLSLVCLGVVLILPLRVLLLCFVLCSVSSM